MRKPVVNLSIAVFILPVACDKFLCAVKDARFVLIVIEAIFNLLFLFNFFLDIFNFYLIDSTIYTSLKKRG